MRRLRGEAEGLPSVIMTIWRMSFFWRRRMRWRGVGLRGCWCNTGRPERGELAEGNLFGGIVEKNEAHVSPGYCVRMRWESAMATRLRE